jgi:molybdenum cofactor guanylyltransferase
MSKKSIIGLVVCGGESSRMGMDKSLIVYHEKPQHYHIYEMLQIICDDVYISCNQKQSPTIHTDYKKIVDSSLYKNIGPMAALLSAFKQFPSNDFLVIACDYPFLKVEDINQLILEENRDQLAVCYQNSETKMIEPLIAYYSQDCYPILLKSFEQKDYSLRHFLKENNSRVISPLSLKNIKSIDTPEAYQESLLIITENNVKRVMHS